MFKTFIFVVECLAFMGIYAIGFFYNATSLISVYGVLVIVYTLLQTTFSYLNEKKYSEIPSYKTIDHDMPEDCENMQTIEIDENKDTDDKKRYNVVLVVGKRENPLYWEKCLLSLKNIHENMYDIFIVIDGNELHDEDMYIKAVDFFQTHKMPLDPKIYRIDTSGKRGAMHYGFLRIKEFYPDIVHRINVITLDSDSEPHPDFLTQIEKCFRDDRIACATGNLSIYNVKESLLTRIIDARYNYAFNIERSASSYFGCMTCCSGPCSIYRLDYLSDDVLNDFINQWICGSKCEPGDDRHLTTLLLLKGYRSAQMPFALCRTEAPADLYRFIHQQLRWFRSFYREIPWQFRSFEKQHIYLTVTSVYEYFFPWFVMFFTVYVLLQKQANVILTRSLIISCVSMFIKIILVSARLRSWKPFYMLLYMPMYYVILLPTKLYAVISISNNDWTTQHRNAIRKTCQCSWNINTLCLYSVIIVWNGFLIVSCIRIVLENYTVTSISRLGDLF